MPFRFNAHPFRFDEVADVRKGEERNSQGKYQFAEKGLSDYNRMKSMDK